ncbi:MAG: hypothetical protein CVU43_16850 [Chloroflexi bacterium HGW-Chloroflexi-5]|jgi:hypothetical protein|nr:MAG: hypothetical protein CVU43_16850 [Chloroflexi bacterium HGW-Chloroflexi-5]
MLILIPIILLLFFAGGINLLVGRYKLSLGSTWLIAAASVLIVWISIIIFRFALPGGASISNWSPQGISTDTLVFNLSERTWIFAFLLTSLLVGVIFTDTVRFGQSNNLVTWSGSMILTAVGLLAIYSQTFLAVIITWTIIDIVEFGILIKVTDQPKIHTAVVIEFFTRIIGTFLVMAALIFSNFHTAIVESSQYTSGVYLLILVGATLRLGVFPLHFPLTSSLPIRRSLGTILRFVAPISVVAFLTQIQPQQQYATLTNVMYAIALIVGFYGAIKWVSAKNELSGRPFWMLSFSGLILIRFLLGQVEGAIGLSIIMVIAGGFIFLYSYSSKVSTIAALFLAISLVGLPFTPTAPIWGFVGNSQNWLLFLVVFITYNLLFLGFIKHVFRQRDQSSPKESWMQLFYTAGLVLLSISPWIILIWRLSIIKSEFNLSAPIGCLILITIMVVIMRRRIWDLLIQKQPAQRLLVPFKLAGKILNSFFQFEWFFALLRRLFDFFARPLKFFANLLEGDGGLLWAFVFLALISSVLVGEILP